MKPLTLICLLATAATACAQPFRIRTGDILRIRILDHWQLESETVVDKQGLLTPKGLLPGKVVGLTIPEIQANLKRAYSRLLNVKDLKVTVLVVLACKRKISTLDTYNCNGTLQTGRRSSYNRLKECVGFARTVMPR